MKHPRLLVALIVLGIAGIVWATPQQLSSGAAVTVVQGGNVAQVTAGGAVKVDGAGNSFPVTGTFWQATQPVSGPLTDTQLRASAVPVSGSFSATPLTACGGTNYDSGLISLPNTSTVLTSTATCINAITLVNITTSPQFCTVTDNQGSPVNLIPPGFELSPKADATFNRNGVRALAGIKWSCTNASAVIGFIRGNQ